MINSRVRVLSILFLSLAHGFASQGLIPFLLLITMIIIIIFYNYFKKGIGLILISISALLMFNILVYLFAVKLPLVELLFGFFRWVSLVTLTVVLFQSLNSLELATSLVKLRLPVNIAIALSVGLRFLPVLYDEARRVSTIQKKRGLSFSSIKEYGLIGFLDRISSPLIVSVLRRVDSLTISISIQQIDQRIKNYKFDKWQFIDWVGFLIISTILILSITTSL